MSKNLKDIERLLSKHGFNKISQGLDTHKKYYNETTNTYFNFISDSKKVFRFSGLVNYCQNKYLINNDLRDLKDYTVLYYALIGYIQVNVYRV